jgi:3-oxoacyl-[acyl-carrier-protein] synthase III
MQHSTKNAYITSVGKFLPGEPVDNEHIEDYLGLVAGKPSVFREKILAANGIKTRHYARLPNGTQTHLNEELAANAVTDALSKRGLTINDVDMLALGTTAGDLLMPGFGVMVHGRLKGRPMEVLTAAGVCGASIAAMRAAINAVRVGDHQVAVCGASEIPSTMLKGTRFESESTLAPARTDTASSFQYFNADFLRWMLSDGAGAAVVESKPRQGGLSLRVEWVTLTSYAHQHPTCMYWGGSDPSNPQPGNTWLSQDSASEADRNGMMVIRQDTKLLGREIVEMGTSELALLVAEKRLNPNAVTHFLPHLSSYFFEEKLCKGYAEKGIDLPLSKWFTNLKTCGNTGSASIYIILADALASGLLHPGDTVLTMVPESGRFSISYGLFTCVSH